MPGDAMPCDGPALGGRPRVPLTAGVPVMTGEWSPVSVSEVDAVVDFLRRPPAQARSVARVATILDRAAHVTRAGEVTTTTLAQRCGMSVGAIYQYFADCDAVFVCVGAVWMRRAITAVQAAVTGDAPTPDELARLLIGGLASYRSRYRPPAPSEAARRARAVRERAWHHQLAAALCPLTTGHASRRAAREAQGLEPRCLTAVTLADQAARTCVGAGSHDRFAAEMARATTRYIAGADLATQT